VSEEVGSVSGRCSDVTIVTRDGVRRRRRGRKEEALLITPIIPQHTTINVTTHHTRHLLKVVNSDVVGKMTRRGVLGRREQSRHTGRVRREGRHLDSAHTHTTVEWLDHRPLFSHSLTYPCEHVVDDGVEMVQVIERLTERLSRCTIREDQRNIVTMTEHHNTTREKEREREREGKNNNHNANTVKGEEKAMTVRDSSGFTIDSASLTLSSLLLNAPTVITWSSESTTPTGTQSVQVNEWWMEQVRRDQTEMGWGWGEVGSRE
jgi:hypothetical protein